MTKLACPRHVGLLETFWHPNLETDWTGVDLTGVNVLYLSSTEMRASSEFLKSRWGATLPITAMQKQHIFRRASATELFISRFASDDVKRVQVIDRSQDHDVDEDEIELHTVQPPQISQSSVCDWVLVKYER